MRVGLEPKPDIELTLREARMLGKVVKNVKIVPEHRNADLNQGAFESEFYDFEEKKVIERPI